MTETMIWAFPGNVSDRQLEGFEVRASDGTIGTVDKATYDVGASYIVVDTGPWIFGKRVLLPAGVIQRVERDAGMVHVARTRDEIRSAPEFEAGQITDAYRQRLGSHYAPDTPAGQPSRGSTQPARQGGSARGRSASATQPARRRSKTRGSSSAKTRGSSAAKTRSSADGPTKEELYNQAKRLGIEGRSNMNKRGLAQAVSRAKGRRAGGTGGTGGTSKGRKASPVEVQKFLDGVSYPTRKGDLLREAQKSRASAKVRSTLERLPDKRFKAPTEVSEAIGQLSRSS